MKQESTFGPHVNDPAEKLLHKVNRKNALGIGVYDVKRKPLFCDYKTDSSKRLTSNAEYNKDAETMRKVKALYLKSQQRWHNEPTPYREAIANIVKRLAFKQKSIIQTKTWGK